VHTNSMYLIEDALKRNDARLLESEFNDAYIINMLNDSKEELIFSQIQQYFDQSVSEQVLEFSLKVLTPRVLPLLTQNLIHLFESRNSQHYEEYVNKNDIHKIEQMIHLLLHLSICNDNAIKFNNHLQRVELLLSKKRITDDFLNILDDLLSLHEIKNEEILYSLYFSKARIAFVLAHYQSSVAYYEKAAEYALALKAFDRYATCHESIGVTYGVIGNYSLQLHYHILTKQIREEHKLYDLIGNCFVNIGLCYMNLGDNVKAEEYYKQGIIYQIRNNNEGDIAIGKFLLSKIIIDENEKITLLKEASVYFKTVNDVSRLSEIYIDMAEAYILQQDYDQAKEYLNLSQQLLQDVTNDPVIGLLYKGLSKYHSSMESLNHDEKLSEDYLCKSIQIFKDLGIKDYAFQALEEYASFLERKERWMEHSKVYKEFHSLQQEVLNAEVQSKIQAFEILQQKEREEHERQLQQIKYQEQEKLLHAILPAQIATKIVEGQTLIAESAESVSVFFMDIVNFTNISSTLSPTALLNSLNDIFSDIDQLAVQYEIEKIKTIGDAYMAVASISNHNPEHAKHIAEFAIAVIERSKDWNLGGHSITVRIGIHVGPVVSGVIGRQRFTFDVWGDTVNIASRLERSSEPNHIHISEELKNILTKYGIFDCINRGEIELKGRGKMQTYWLKN
jgi:class 3 adenylate cyclase